jgi:hypothetical protein
MAGGTDQTVEKAIRFLWFCIAVYLLSAAAWIFLQRHQGHSYFSVILEARFIIATVSTCTLVLWVWYLARKVKARSQPPPN